MVTYLTAIKIGSFTVSVNDLVWARKQLDLKKNESVSNLSELDATLKVVAVGKQLSQRGFPEDACTSFCETVCTWGRGQRVFANLIRNHGTRKKLGKTLSESFGLAVSSIDDRGAIEPLEKIKGLGISFASKHLRMLLPQRFGVLDSRYSEELGFALNTNGYLFFMQQLREFAGELKSKSP